MKKKNKTLSWDECVAVHWVYLDSKTKIAKKYMDTWIQGQLRKDQRIAALLNTHVHVSTKVHSDGLWCALVPQSFVNHGMIMEVKPEEVLNQIQIDIQPWGKRVWVYVCTRAHSWGAWFEADQALGYVKAMQQMHPNGAVHVHQSEHALDGVLQESWNNLKALATHKHEQPWQPQGHTYGNKGGEKVVFSKKTLTVLSVLSLLGLSVWGQKIWSDQQYSSALLRQEQVWLKDHGKRLGFVMDLEKQLKALPNSEGYEKKQRIEQLKGLIERVPVPIKKAGWGANGIYVIPQWDRVTTEQEQKINAFLEKGEMVLKEADGEKLLYTVKVGVIDTSKVAP